MKNKSFSKRPIDFILLIVVIIMLAFGLVMVMSSSSPTSIAETGKSYGYVKTQAISAFLGIIAMAIISKIDYRIYKGFYKLIYIVVIILLASVAVVGVGAGGAKRWIYLGFMSFQPSEIAKVGLIIFYAALLTKNKETLGEMVKGFFYPLVFLIPVIAILILVQNHLSATLLMIMIVAVMMYMAGTKLRYFLTFGTAGAAARRIRIIFICKSN